MIICENLCRYYGSFLAVDNLCVTIDKGAMCALVGPNGAGKTTTMRMLSTILPPSRGHAEIGGRDVVREPSGVRALIGYLPEAFQFYDDMSVECYLEFFARAYGLDPESTGGRIADFLERLGLQEKRRSRIRELSRGMKQRLGVAKSFLHDPEVVFLDEPASGLDPVARTDLRDFLKYQQRLGKTVVVSSHVLRELADFCDHIMIIRDGRLVEYGPLTGANGVLARYAEAAAEGRQYTIQLVKDAARLEEVLAEKDGISTIRRRDATITFELLGDEETAAELLADIVARGYRVSRFGAEEIDLETVYRKASGGESER
jgi:ABC-2 type transport system ATP-binding protein